MQGARSSVGRRRTWGGGGVHPRQLVAEERWTHTPCVYLHVSLPPKLSLNSRN